MTMKIVKKISARTMVGNVKAYSKDLQNGQNIDIMRVVGLARSLKMGETNFGEWTALIGDFVVEPLVGDKAGNRYRTGQLFLPDVALNLVQGAVNNISRGDAIQMAFTIGIEADDTVMIGYIYTAAFLIEPETNDPMEALIQKALPAPEKKEPAKTTAKA